MDRARVLILSDYVGSGSAALGGAGIAALASYAALDDAGVDVRVIAGFTGADAPGPGDGRLRSLGGRDLRAGSAGDALRIVYNRPARSALARLLAQEDPARTIVILNQWTRFLTPAALDLLRPFRTMIYMHDYFWACPNGAYFDFRLGRPCWRRPMGPACLTADCDRQGRAHKAVRIARHTALGWAARGGAANRLFLHISDLARRTAEPLLPGEAHATLHNPTPIGVPSAPAAPPVFDIGYVGRLEPEKGVADLLALIGRRGLRALFVGDGSLVDAIERTPGAERLAWLPHDRMAQEMQRCRAIALPSLWPETWGLVTAEAMAAQVPVLVSARAGSAELVYSFGGGAVFEPDREGDLERALDTLLDRPPERIRLTDPARAALADMLSAPRHAGRIIALAADRWNLDIGR